MKKLLFGYVIRDEKLAKGEDYENGISQIKSEGEKVAKGASIFRYHASNEEELNKKIEELNSKIQEALIGRTDPFPGDVKAIENQIENKIDGLKFKNSIQNIKEYKNDINTYVRKKSKIVGELSQAGSYINGLIKEKEGYEAKLKSQSKYVIAPISGIVSYRVDGLEEELTPESFDNLSKDYLEELNLKIGQIVSTGNKMGKVINNYECYIATVLSSEDAKKAKVGKKINIRLSSQDEIPAEISYISEQDNKSVLIVFKINQNVEELIEYRKISFDVIWWSDDGLRVPKSAIAYDNGLAYVVRTRGGYYEKILVEVLKENDNYCIVNNYENKDLKEMGYDASQIRSMKKISIYDELIINPDLSNIN